MRKIIVIVSIFLSGCATPGGAIFSNDEETWYSEHKSVLGLVSWNEIYLCKANKDSKNRPRPVCLRPDFLDVRYIKNKEEATDPTTK